ncbi:DNA polymerase Y family protein [Psychrosphaera sp. B3R10]|nr:MULTISPECIES: DNA polymerase Y family protein [unclassified Psychrosphaera]MBU2880653.1 DNA polymerase Y family protein [Psychrosphaera sp. I2R16]MBU2990739.1 DNA polymerase Y family protein [Psychrosphaera sp. B3R10]MDO6720859.1 DNA polymerase Y family protein [Psychrosphaera sp. 1_MG-2023]
MLWLYLDFHSLQLDALDSSRETLRTELTPAPEVVIIVDAKKNEVVQLNAMAKSQGITQGMGLATALSLHQHIQVMEYKPDIEFRTLQQLAQLLYEFTADIALAFPHGMYLRIDNMLCLYKGLLSYWQQIEYVLKPIGYQYDYATGTTPAMAKVLAQAKLNTLLDDPKKLKQALYGLAIEQLELEPKALNALHRVGVKQTKQLLALSLKEMAKRFDIHLLNYIGKLMGEFKHGLIFYRPPAEFNVDIELLFEIENSQILQHPIKRLLIQLEQFLSIRGLVTQQLTLHLRYRYLEFIELSINRAQGEYKMEKWLSLVRLKLESVKLAEPVVAIRLLARQLRPLTADSGDLFSQKSPQVSVDELVAVIQAKLGDNKVKGVCLIDQHHPQLATQYSEGLAIENTIENTKGRAADQKTFEGRYKLRPSLMTAVAVPLKEHVSILHGPERIQTNWWHEHSIQRDYYIARSDKGRLCWVYRTPQKNWYLQGYFA